jgi:hypothetical protein
MDPTKITGPIGEVIQAYERLLKVQRDVQSGINEMAAGIRASRNAVSGMVTQMQQGAAAARAWAGAMRTIGSIGGPSGSAPAGYQGPNVKYGRGTMPGAALVPIGSGGGMAPPGGSNLPAVPGGGQPYFPWGFPNPRIVRAPSDTDLLMAGVGAEQAGRAALGGAASIFDAGADAGSLLAKMNANTGFTPETVAQSKALARRLVGDVPGMSVSEALELILQTSSFTGDAKEALTLSPTLARDAQVLAQYGHKDAITQIEQAIKAGELTGLTTKTGGINIPKLTEFVNRLTAVDVSAGGTMDMGKYLTSIRMYGVGADAASMDFVTAVLPAYQKIMGEAKAGTALSSMMQSLSQVAPNTQNKKFIEEQKRIGVRDKSGEVVQGDLLRTDTNAWITGVLLPAILKTGAVSPQKISEEMYKILPRQTMVRLVGAGIFDAGVIEKEAARNRAQIAAGAGPLDKLLTDSPQNQIKAFSAALNLLEVTLADPAMGNATGALKTLTNVLLGFSSWSEKNPGLSNAAVTGAAGLGGASYFAGTALILGYFAKKALDVGKWGMDLFKGGNISPKEGIFDAIDGSSIAGRAVRGALPGVAKVAEPIALALMIQNEFQHDVQQFTDSIKQLREDWKKGDWLGLHPFGDKAVQMTGVVNLDGKKIGTFGAKPSAAYNTQGGTSQFDGKMTPLPAGLPSGGGN